MSDSVQLLLRIKAELTCPLWDCVINTLEGPGISKSECTVCSAPGWKKDLQFNPLYQNLVNALQPMLKEAGVVDDQSLEREQKEAGKPGKTAQPSASRTRRVRDGVPAKPTAIVKCRHRSNRNKSCGTSTDPVFQQQPDSNNACRRNSSHIPASATSPAKSPFPSAAPLSSPTLASPATASLSAKSPFPSAAPILRPTLAAPVTAPIPAKSAMPLDAPVSIPALPSLVTASIPGKSAMPLDAPVAIPALPSPARSLPASSPGPQQSGPVISNSQSEDTPAKLAPHMGPHMGTHMATPTSRMHNPTSTSLNPSLTARRSWAAIFPPDQPQPARAAHRREPFRELSVANALWVDLAEGNMVAKNDGGVTDADGLSLAEGNTDAEGRTVTDADGLGLAEGNTDAEGRNVTDADGMGRAEGNMGAHVSKDATGKGPKGCTPALVVQVDPAGQIASAEETEQGNMNLQQANLADPSADVGNPEHHPGGGRSPRRSKYPPRRGRVRFSMPVLPHVDEAPPAAPLPLGTEPTQPDPETLIMPVRRGRRRTHPVLRSDASAPVPQSSKPTPSGSNFATTHHHTAKPSECELPEGSCETSALKETPSEREPTAGVGEVSARRGRVAKSSAERVQAAAGDEVHWDGSNEGARGRGKRLRSGAKTLQTAHAQEAAPVLIREGRGSETGMQVSAEGRRGTEEGNDGRGDLGVTRVSTGDYQGGEESRKRPALQARKGGYNTGPEQSSGGLHDDRLHPRASTGAPVGALLGKAGGDGVADRSQAGQNTEAEQSQVGRKTEAGGQNAAEWAAGFLMEAGGGCLDKPGSSCTSCSIQAGLADRTPSAQGGRTRSLPGSVASPAQRSGTPGGFDTAAGSSGAEMSLGMVEAVPDSVGAQGKPVQREAHFEGGSAGRHMAALDGNAVLAERWSQGMDVQIGGGREGGRGAGYVDSREGREGGHRAGYVEIREGREGGHGAGWMAYRAPPRQRLGVDEITALAAQVMTQVMSKAPPAEDDIPGLCLEVSALEAAFEAAAKELAKFRSGMAGTVDIRRNLRDIDAAVRARGVQ